MSIVTKTGDKGSTSLFTGERVKKNSLRVETYGSIDELRSALGLARAFTEDDKIKNFVLELEKTLLNLMADLASITDDYIINEKSVAEIEQDIISYESTLPPLTKFIHPGDSKAGAFFDLARTITRRCERLVLSLDECEKVNPQIKIYLNRLSDLCFLLQRIEDSR